MLETTVETVSKRYRDGQHVGPAAWLDIIHAVNKLERDSFRSPTAYDERPNGVIERYGDRFSVDIDNAGERVRICAHGEEASELLVQAMGQVKALEDEGRLPDNQLYRAQSKGHLNRLGHILRGYLVTDGELTELRRTCCTKG